MWHLWAGQGNLASTARCAPAAWKCVNSVVVGRRLSDTPQLPTNMHCGRLRRDVKYSLFHATHNLLNTTHRFEHRFDSSSMSRAIFAISVRSCISGFRDWRDFGIGIGIEIPSRSRDPDPGIAISTYNTYHTSRNKSRRSTFLHLVASDDFALTWGH